MNPATSRRPTPAPVGQRLRYQQRRNGDDGWTLGGKRVRPGDTLRLQIVSGSEYFARAGRGNRVTTAVNWLTVTVLSSPVADLGELPAQACTHEQTALTLRIAARGASRTQFVATKHMHLCWPSQGRS